MAGEREALGLPARKMHRAPVEGDAPEADVLQALPHARPDFLARDAAILGTEGDVIAQTVEDRLRIRILQDEPHATMRLRGRDSPDGDAALGLPAVLVGGTRLR